MTDEENVSRRRAMGHAALVAAVALVAGCGGGGAATPPAPLLTQPPPPPPPLPPPPPPPPPATPTARLKAAIMSAQEPRVVDVGLSVSQLASNQGAPSLGANAVLWPAPQGSGVNPNPVTLAELAQVWGFRRSMWRKGAASLSGSTAANASWYMPVALSHPAATLSSGAPCAFHFLFDGSAFEVLFAGNDVNAVLMVDGQHASARWISRTLQGGVQGAPLSSFDTYTRFDFGSRAPRRLSLWCRSTIGPKAFVVAAGDTLQPWDRSAEPSVVFQADSYGGSPSARWGSGGLFFEAAQALGLVNVDLDAIGSTGYAPNNVSLDAGNAFPARMRALVAEPPELFFVAGGINDNNSLALPPYATPDAARAGFEGAAASLFSGLRTALPDAVLGAMGPWQPNEGYLIDVARSKAAAIRAALQAAGGPWVFIDNIDGGWSNSSGASATGARWQTGTGTVAVPRGDGNADLYVSADGTHPTEAGASYLATQLAQSIKAAVAAL